MWREKPAWTHKVQIPVSCVFHKVFTDRIIWRNYARLGLPRRHACVLLMSAMVWAGYVTRVKHTQPCLFQSNWQIHKYSDPVLKMYVYTTPCANDSRGGCGYYGENKWSIIRWFHSSRCEIKSESDFHLFTDPASRSLQHHDKPSTVSFYVYVNTFWALIALKIHVKPSPIWCWRRKQFYDHILYQQCWRGVI